MWLRLSVYLHLVLINKEMNLHCWTQRFLGCPFPSEIEAEVRDALEESEVDYLGVGRYFFNSLLPKWQAVATPAMYVNWGVECRELTLPQDLKNSTLSQRCRRVEYHLHRYVEKSFQ